MTTIKLKNGSGAPSAGNLVQGEPALDLTNKRLYTENSSGTVIEVGTNPSTINIDAGTIDGTVIGGSTAAAGSFTTFTSTGIDDNATSTAMTLDSSGKMLIGDSSSHTSDLLQIETPASGGGHGIQIRRNDSNNDQTVGHILFGNNTDTSLAGISAKTDGVTDSGALLFNTSATGGSNTERMRIDSSGNVGIGLTNPSAYFAENLVVAAADEGGITIECGSTEKAYLMFADGTSGSQAYRGYIGYDHSTDFMNVVSSGVMNFFSGDPSAEAMRIDASGNLLVGTTDTNPANDASGTGVAIGNGGWVAAARDGDTSGMFNRLTSNGNIVTFQRDGSTVGSIGSALGDSSVSTLFIADGGNVGLRFDQASTDDIQPCTTTGGNRDAAINLGAAGNRFKDLYLSGAVNLGGDVLPTTDAGLTGHSDLGDPAKRFEDAYVRDGVTTGSDRRDKQDIEELSDAEQRVAVACKGLLRKWRWIDAVEAKGDDARIHFGIIAQDLQDAFTAEGLDAGRYAMFINSTWTDEETGEERSRMGVRYSELLAFIIAAI
jgi:hypothetical protein